MTDNDPLDATTVKRLGLEPGKSFREWYGEGNPNNRLIHIRAIVDDEYIVFRWWSYRKQRWRYQIEHVTHFFVGGNMGHLKEA